MFEILVRNGVLPDTFLPALRKMAGFRNIVVHEYVRIDDAQVYGMFRSNLPDFETYASAIVVFLMTEDASKEA